MLLMVQKSSDHQLRLVVCPIIYKVLYIKGGAGCLPSTVVSWHLLFLVTKVASSTDSGARIHAKLDHCLSGVWEFLTLDFSNFKKRHVFFGTGVTCDPTYGSLATLPP